MPSLDGSGLPVAVDGENITLTAPGFIGEVTAHDGSDETTRSASPGLFPPVFSEILDSHGFRSASTLQIDLNPTITPDATAVTRSSDGQAAITLETPWLGEGYGQIALCVDESGVATWHIPTIDEDAGTTRFLLRSPETQLGSPDDEVHRGVIGISARLVKTFIYEMASSSGEGAVSAIAREWEQAKRPYRLCGFAPGHGEDARTAELTTDQVRALGSPSGSPDRARALLFLHGTFSTTDAGFGQLPDETLADLHQAYDGRVFAFDHPTLHVDPIDNVREFLTMVPDDIQLDLDLVAHSRGGLVARTLAGTHRDLPIDRDRVSVGRAVFAGTPNQGSRLTSPDYLPELIDSYTTALNVVNFGPVTELLDAVLIGVKILAHDSVEGLEGLSAADPDGEFMAGLGSAPPDGMDFYGLAADFAPPNPGVAEFLARAVDGLMGAEHDLVVTADSVHLDAMAAYHRYQRADAVHHSGYFEQAETQGLLREWLPG